MKRAVLLVIPLFLWLVATPLSLAPTLEAVTFNCILTNACTTPPPCEFFTKLKLAKAAARIFANVRAPLSRAKASFEQYNDETGAQMQKAFRKDSKCPLPESPTFRVSAPPKCEIGARDAAGFRPRSVDDMLRASNGCSEAVEADYAWAQHVQTLCPSFKPGRTVAEERAASLLAQQTKVNSLEQSLLKFLSSCAPDAKMARQISKMGLGSLLKAGKKARQEWTAERIRAAQRAAWVGL